MIEIAGRDLIVANPAMLRMMTLLERLSKVDPGQAPARSRYQYRYDEVVATALGTMTVANTIAVMRASYE